MALTLLRARHPEASLPILDSVAEVCRFVRAAPGIYVRFSRGPEADRGGGSCDFESGLELPGLSASTLDPEPWWTLPLEDWVARRLCAYVHLIDEAAEERRAWLMRGRVVARGPDHEPLLADVRAIAWVTMAALAEAKARYRERFEVGRTSTG
jgi:hypothetical protein